MRLALIIVFSAFLLAMIAMTVWATLDRAVWNAGSHLVGDRWFQATLLDAYLGFLTFYLWVCYKERSVMRRVVWFVLIMTLGNMAMASYMLVQLIGWREEEGVVALLSPRRDAVD